MSIIAYYEGSDSTKEWLSALLGIEIEYKKMPNSNDSKDFTKLPAYVADILFLDKPDIIISGNLDGVHERPIFSIEFASCTPQYQHALQRFSRMVASVSSGCPSALILPMKKRENNGGARTYVRSRAVEYGAVKLMDTYQIPAFVFEWPDTDGILASQNGMADMPPLDSPPILQLASLIKQALQSFHNTDYVASLWKTPIVRLLTEVARTRAYQNGPPTIERPGGGDGDAGSSPKLDLIETSELITKIKASVLNSKNTLDQIPDFVSGRQKSLVFYPTRVVPHAGDPYVGMIGYYDIAFCRNGPTERDRTHNLVAWCKGVSIDEIQGAMKKYNSDACPFVNPVSHSNVLKYSYHLKYGCRSTKVKPIRIYSELADIIVFDDGVILNVG